MKFSFVAFSITLGIIIGMFFTILFPKIITTNNQKINPSPKPKPLEKYTYENLTRTGFEPAEIVIGDIIKEEKDFTSRKFYFYFDPFIDSGQSKKVSGLINLPNIPGTYPVIVMLRGFVDKEIFQTGVGTQRAGEFFAQNGYITLAPDFLGYGESDNPSELAIEERFQTYVTVLTLLKSLQNLNSQFSTFNFQLQADFNRLGIWAHSNGGQIALTVLEITGANYPTVLWAPVSKPFPYSILYYTDEFDDHGKSLRKVVADFEQDYDVEAHSLTNFLDRIQAPIQLHQGTADEAVPVKWSDNLNQSLKDKEIKIDYFRYPGADHNLSPGWNKAIQRSLEFYTKNLRQIP